MRFFSTGVSCLVAGSRVWPDFSAASAVATRAFHASVIDLYSAFSAGVSPTLGRAASSASDIRCSATPGTALAGLAVPVGVGPPWPGSTPPVV